MFDWNKFARIKRAPKATSSTSTNGNHQENNQTTVEQGTSIPTVKTAYPMRTIWDWVWNVEHVFVKVTVRLAIVGILLHCATYFYPGLPEEYPMIYQWFTGWTHFYEFLVKSSLRLFGALFQGEPISFFREFAKALGENWEIFRDWIFAIRL